MVPAEMRAAEAGDAGQCGEKELGEVRHFFLSRFLERNGILRELIEGPRTGGVLIITALDITSSTPGTRDTCADRLAQPSNSTIEHSYVDIWILG
jgi:hypothetical protein